MVKLHVKRGDESQFLYETTVAIPVADLMIQVVRLFNGRLKVDRLCQEIELLAQYGVLLPGNMQGLTEEQVTELKLKDDYEDVCVPSGGFIMTPDPMGRRNGRASNDKMKDVLKRTISEARAAISKKQASAGVYMTEDIIQDALDKLRGAVTIVYPMNLPSYDPVRLEFEGNEDLSGTQAATLVLDEHTAQLWWAGKAFAREKKLSDYLGRNEKTTVVVKLQKKGQGAPARESVFSEEEQKQMMAHAYRKQEEMKVCSSPLPRSLPVIKESQVSLTEGKLDADSEHSYLNADWADSQALRKQLAGVQDIGWRPR